jgi:hypothetical protein
MAVAAAIQELTDRAVIESVVAAVYGPLYLGGGQLRTLLEHPRDYPADRVLLGRLVPRAWSASCCHELNSSPRSDASLCDRFAQTWQCRHGFVSTFHRLS